MISRMISKGFLGTRPAHLILQVTDSCSLSCRTCFQRPEGKHDLGLSRIQQVAEWLGRDLLWLELSGGEPFLRNDLPNIASLFQADLISISTNGQAPEAIFHAVREIRDRLSKDTELSISVSMDGFRETNDSLRGKGSFAKALETLTLLKRVEGVKRKVNTVLCDRNHREILRFMRYVRTLGPDFHSIILLRGDPRDGGLALPPLEALQSLKQEIFRIWDSYDYGLQSRFRTRILKNYQRLSFETSLEILEKKMQMPRCLAGTRHLVVMADGDVAFCELGPSLGNLYRQGLDGILTSEEAKRQRAAIASGHCFCHHNCNMMDNVLLNPRHAAGLLIRRRT